jgi:MtN3 and saliva related transmembrane protein
MVLEAHVNTLALLATIFGSAMSLAYFPQVYKMYKRKSSGDISVITFSVFLVGMIVWLLYGIALNNMPLIIANVIGFVGAACVLTVYYHYKK